MEKYYFVTRKSVERFARDQKVKETGAFSKGLNKGFNIIISALRDGHTLPAADVIPIEWIEAQVDKGKWAELVQRWREANDKR